MKTIDLSDLKAGDKAWSATKGEVEITAVDKTQIYGVEVVTCIGTNLTFRLNGMYVAEDTHPALFHSEKEFREYWGMEKTETNEKREFTKKAAIALLYAGNLPNQNACRKAIEFTEIFFNELNELNEKQ